MVPGSLAKYRWNDPNEARLHPGPIVGRRPSDGFPVLGTPGRVPDMRGEEVEELPVVSQFCSGTFRLWLPEEARRYNEVMDHCVNGQFVVSHRDHMKAGPAEHNDGEGERIKVYVEWLQVYLQSPEGPGGPRRGY